MNYQVEKDSQDTQMRKQKLPLLQLSVFVQPWFAEQGNAEFIS